ncbi:hypothetical protein CBM2589_B10052 [Cupriavidus taiwanensis]|uniref:Uncharacterized protein n=1 Tax=Cupriavidus taiwanensis TaxID=164546 RepID=A0A975WN89_9BURK|nr:hypothetical protein CBM2589_B10052 [Cupriavidus taiwanensis]
MLAAVGDATIALRLITKLIVAMPPSIL